MSTIISVDYSGLEEQLQGLLLVSGHFVIYPATLDSAWYGDLSSGIRGRHLTFAINKLISMRFSKLDVIYLVLPRCRCDVAGSLAAANAV
jgi:hypothetical protein